MRQKQICVLLITRRLTTWRSTVEGYDYVSTAIFTSIRNGTRIKLFFVSKLSLVIAYFCNRAWDADVDMLHMFSEKRGHCTPQKTIQKRMRDAIIPHASPKTTFQGLVDRIYSRIENPFKNFWRICRYISLP